MGSLEDKRQKESRLRDKKRRDVNEIGEIPAVVDPERRRACERDPQLWLRTYLPDQFFMPFSDSQSDFIRAAWSAIQNRAYQNINAYRGFGKTTIERGLVLMTHAIGLTRYAFYVSSIDSVNVEAAAFFADALFEPMLDVDDERFYRPEKPLAQDYPEICYPIAWRDGVAQRPVLYQGRHTRIELKTEKVVFPLIPGSPSSHSIIVFSSIHSNAIRGRLWTIPGVGSVRPDIVMIDDVQSDGTAKSQVEVDNIENTIKNSIEGLAGLDRATGKKQSLIILSALTQNQPDDVAIRMLKHPEYCTRIYRFLRRIPSDFAPWRKYREYREEVYRRHNSKEKVIPLLKRYYNKHRTEIEAGVEEDNPALFEEGQVSATHYALEWWCKSEKAFWCELQNDAVRASQETAGGLAPVLITRKKRHRTPKLNSRALKRYEIPKDTKLLTAYIDCGEHYHNYQVTAFGPGYSFAHVVDFGIWPEQDFPEITKKTFRRDIQDVYTRGNTFDKVGDAVVDCLKMIFTQQYFDHRGEPFDVHFETDLPQHGNKNKPFRFLSVCGVDCSDGEMEFSLWSAIDRFHRLDNGLWYARAVPCYGDAAQSRLLRYYDLKRGEWRRGRRQTGTCDWIENPDRSSGIRRNFANIPVSLLYDANTAKTRRNAAWLTDMDRPGAASLFDWPEQEYLTMFARQQCSEEFFETRKSNMVYNVWRMKRPRVADNEFLDTDAGTWALADYAGLEFGAKAGRPRRSVAVVRPPAAAGDSPAGAAGPPPSDRPKLNIAIIRNVQD